MKSAPILFLAGMPGAGKTTVGRRVAARLGAPFHDLDDAVAAADPAGRRAARILAEDGEPAFRAAEAAALRALMAELTRPAPAAALSWRAVVATGGGTVIDPATRGALERAGVVVVLEADPATLARRLGATAGDRPLLPMPDVASVARLAAARRAAYDALPWHAAAGDDDLEAVAARVAALAAAVAPPRGVRAVPVAVAGGPVGGTSGGYAVLVGTGLLDALGAILTARGAGEAVMVVTDAHVGPLHAARVAAALVAGGATVAATHVLPAGEAAKTPRALARLWDALAAAGLDRDGTVLALGGGAVTDAAGLAAATWLRGVRLVNVPTSLLGMVDAAVGGKTGIDLPAGKNLVGAFHAPALVVADVATLATQPAELRRHGLAELVKAAVLDGEEMLADLEAAASRGTFDALPAPGGDPAAAPRVQGPREADPSPWSPWSPWIDWIARGVALKARHVGDDLREARGGPREHLNLGHTFAHALERASDYALPHGHAVAVGLVAAARLAEALARGGDASTTARTAPLAVRLERLLDRLGLPTRWFGPSVDAVVAAMATDKKRAAGRLRFVLPTAPGAVAVRPAPPDAVGAVLAALRHPDASDV